MLKQVNSTNNQAIGAGIVSGAFWGTPFLAPLILVQFSSLEIAFVRFLFFGLISLISLPRLIPLLRQFSWVDVLQALVLSASGFWLYTLVLFAAVKLSNGVVAALIVGILPLTITLFSQPKFNYQLLLGLALIWVGIIVLFIPPLLFGNGAKSSLTNVHLFGVILLFLALILWTWYAISNSRFILKHPRLRSLDYSSLMGLLSFLCLLPIFLLKNDVNHIIENPQVLQLLVWGAILGIGASWIANIFWAYCCRNTPPSIYGTLIVSETVFGLIYSFAFQHRLPYLNELLAILLLISGVVVTIRSQLAKFKKIVQN